MMLYIAPRLPVVHHSWKQQMKADFDVIVVGAGPSGTAGACQLARSGYRVLMLDKASFPRVKPCGGGITIKALDLLPYSAR
jgi:flavin-dependent dehydrogenase